MKYTSTRGGMAAKPFTEILLGGLADDGGLAVPDHYPKLSQAELAAMRGFIDRSAQVARTLLDAG